MLSECHVKSICDYLDLGVGNTSIEYNNTDCNTQTEVEAACILGVENKDNADELLIYPNPVDEYLHIEGLEQVNKIRIYNQLGQTVLRSVSGYMIDVSEIKPGLYIIEIITNTQTFKQQLIIN